MLVDIELALYWLHVKRFYGSSQPYARYAVWLQMADGVGQAPVEINLVNVATGILSIRAHQVACQLIGFQISGVLTSVCV